MADEPVDVVIVGAGPAGLTAAILLKQKERSVVLVESGSFPRSGGGWVWLNAQVMGLIKALGVSKKSIDTRPVRNVTFFSADFSKSATPALNASAAILTRRSTLVNALVDAYAALDAQLLQDWKASDVRLGETDVTVANENGSTITARMVLLAAGFSASLLSRCGLHRVANHKPLWTATVGTKLSKAASAASVGIVLGLDKKNSFAVIQTVEDELCVSVHCGGDRKDAVPTLINVCKMAHEHKVVSEDLAKTAAAAKVLPSPASTALDMDSHVGKHALLIGDSGGFIAAASNEGIYPAMWSAQIAVDVLQNAFTSKYPQDELKAFDAQWRIQMADYLRSPNTDTQFLLPLIFTNQAMADRMGAAFFSGENI